MYNFAMAMRVTFDSNVWERIVDEEKRKHFASGGRLYDAILQKQIEPFFFEGFLKKVPGYWGVLKKL
jgi:hypothetical protein